MQIVPSLLTSDISEFERQYLRLLPHFTTFQIDVQDGQYVPSITLSLSVLYMFFSSIDTSRLSLFQKSVFDLHLMQENYSSSIEYVIRLQSFISIRYVFVHLNYPSFQDDRKSVCFCPTFNPDDTIRAQMTFRNTPLHNYPALQLMTIHPGPQGQEFLSHTLLKIQTLRTHGYKGQIFIDGSVNEKSLTHILHLPPSSRPDTVCVGSYFSKAEDACLSHRTHTLKTLVEG